MVIRLSHHSPSLISCRCSFRTQTLFPSYPRFDIFNQIEKVKLMRMQLLIRTLLVGLVAATFAFGQDSTPKSPNPVLLTIGGEVATSVKLTAADLAKLPRRSVQAKDHDGKDTAFE